MIDLSTDYLGLRLKNPLVPSSSPLCKDLDTLLRLEEAGASAVVLHSLYEEELIAEDAMTERFLLHSDVHDGESAGFLPDHGIYNGGRIRSSRADVVRLSPWSPSLGGTIPRRL
ncbi:MAG: hypothetical protein J0L85_20250 [Zoogloea sp.]|nr:hypothetical protein [Zoogloea sp.]